MNQILFMLILFFSCSAEEKKTFEANETSPIENIDSSSNKEAQKEMSDSINELNSKFQLHDPDMKQISYQALSSGDSRLYLYLVNNYDSLESKVLMGRSEALRHPCEFSQAFSGGIIYYQATCSNGVSQYELTMPKINLSDLKLLFIKLFDSGGYYHWSVDSLFHRTSADGINGTGGEYLYELLDDKLKVTITYTD
ncbi:MAG: hypothetical protein KDE33_18395 [Bacteroidetes bacterium]|nr:hypothetical protein [Bacteroidota bacterium]